MNPYTLEDAEHDLRTALDNNDQAELARLEPIIDALDVHPFSPTLGSAALWYAEQGIPVFPCQPQGKQPATRHGFKDATLNPAQIRTWWEAMPTANIGLATGHRFDAIDIDGHAGQQSRLAHWDDIFAAVDAAKLAVVLTPRPGGMHIYVPPSGRGNHANLLPAIDYRGLGGYVVAPPSRTDQGIYSFLGTPHLASMEAIA